MFRRLLYSLLLANALMLASECFLVPVKASTGVVVLPTASGYLNDSGFFYVVGEVQNTDDAAVTDVYVNATFYNSTGDLVAEISQPTKLYTILPGRTSPFVIPLYSTIESQKVHNYTIRVVNSSTTQNGQVGLEIMSNSSSLESNGFQINGTIKNIGNQNASFVRVIATFYNSSRHAIDAILKDSDPSSLGINQTAPFSITLNTTEATQVDHYVLEAEAYDSNLIPDYELIPEFQPVLLTFILSVLTVALVQELKLSSRQKTSARKIRTLIQACQIDL